MEHPRNAMTSDVEGLRWLYAELLRIERHWTDQVQNQQQRISTLLTVTGILLGFLAGAGFLTGTLSLPVHHWPAYVYIASLVSLCFALFMGIRALRPSIPISGTSLNSPNSPKSRSPFVKATVDLLVAFRPKRSFQQDEMALWLDARAVRDKAGSSSEGDLLRELCDAAAANREKANHRDVLLERRLLMYRQFVFLLLSLVLLVCALVGFLVSGGLR